MSNRMDEANMNLTKEVLKAAIDNLIWRFEEGTGWNVSRMGLGTVEVNEMGNPNPQYVRSYFEIEVN